MCKKWLIIGDKVVTYGGNKDCSITGTIIKIDYTNEVAIVKYDSGPIVSDPFRFRFLDILE